MKKTKTEYIADTGEFFFFFIGILYSIGFLLNSNQLYTLEYEYFVNFADLPFLFSATVYFFFSMIERLKHYNPEKKDFFWQYFISLFMGSIIFFSYFIIDILT